MKSILLLCFVSLCAVCTAQSPDPAQALLPFQQNGNWGFIDTTGAVVILPRFEYLAPFHEGLALASEHDKYGFINPQGEFVIPAQYEEAANFHNGLAFVRDQNGSMLINAANEVLLRSDSRYLYSDDSLYLFTKGELWGAYNANTQKVCIEPVHEWIDGFSEGLAAFIQNDKLGYLNTVGEVVIAPAFDDAKPFHEGLAAVKQNELFGYINRKGKWMIKPAFSQAESFSNGIAPAAEPPPEFAPLDEKQAVDAFFEDPPRPRNWGYINKKGKWVIPPRYTYAHSGVGGLFRVYLEKKSALLDVKGNTVIPMQERDISLLEKDRIVVVDDAGAHFYSREGSLLHTVPEVRFVYPVRPGFYWFSRNCRDQDWMMQESRCLYGYLNAAGKVIVEPTR